MIKGIFGNSKNNESTNEAEEKDFSKIYPVIKNGSWSGIASGALTQNLVGEKENPKVVIAYGYNSSQNFHFLTTADLEKLKSDEILKTAYSNLTKFKTEFELAPQEEGNIVFTDEKEFTSEMMLDKQKMLEAHQLLESDEILVSIPRRTTMVIIRRDANDELFNTFVALHDHTWNDDSIENEQIANMLFVLEKGEIIGVIPFEK